MAIIKSDDCCFTGVLLTSKKTPSLTNSLVINRTSKIAFLMGLTSETFYGINIYNVNKRYITLHFTNLENLE